MSMAPKGTYLAYKETMPATTKKRVTGMQKENFLKQKCIISIGGFCNVPDYKKIHFNLAVQQSSTVSCYIIKFMVDINASRCNSIPFNFYVNIGY